MTLYLIGVNHFDPTGRRRLRTELSELARAHSSSPAFIAVEYDSVLAERIIEQKIRFQKLLHEEWPTMSEEHLKELVDSLAYEAYSHTDIYPSVPTVWLDAG